MRNIEKGAEPKSLEEHRCNTFAAYDNYGDAQGLRETLIAEQRGLCCYCMSRIAPDPAKMKIEHWQSQKGFPQRQLEYSNLLGACLGGEGRPPKLQHCDTRKGDLSLSQNPADPGHDVERVLHYEKDGTIRSTDPQFDIEINNILNLNLPVLKNNRKATLNRFVTEGPKHGDWSAPWLEHRLSEWSGESSTGPLDPYCQVVVYWLRKRLRRG